jgi:hypothetical protein
MKLVWIWCHGRVGKASFGTLFLFGEGKRIHGLNDTGMGRLDFEITGIVTSDWISAYIKKLAMGYPVQEHTQHNM